MVSAMRDAFRRSGVILLGCVLLSAACRGKPHEAVARPDEPVSGALENSAALEAQGPPQDAVQEKAKPRPDMTHITSMAVKKLKEFPERPRRAWPFIPMESAGTAPP